MKKRALVLLLNTIIIISLLVGCNTGAQPANTPTPAPDSQSNAVVAETANPENTAAVPEVSKESWTFTDQSDNEVTVQIPIERMVVLQHHSLDILTQLGAQEQIVGVESNWMRNLGSYMTDVFQNIESLPTPGDLTEWNVEEIANLKPDVVIAAAQANPEAMQKVRDLGIPVVVVSLRGEGKQEQAQSPRLSDADKAYTEGCEWALKTLGKLTGRDEKAERIWDFCLESRALVEEAVGEMAEADRVRVFVTQPGDQTYGNDKYVGCQLLRAGAINVAAAEIQGNGAYTFEKLAEWNPDFIIVQDRYIEIYEQFTSDDKYKILKAVQEDGLLLAPYWSKPWGNPDTDSIALGELWLTHKFYPEKISADLVLDRVQTFYQDFYGVPFNGEV